MATSCDPFLGEKRYDDRFYISSYPFSEYGRKWWYCDPQCKPKKGDWVGFWIALKKSLTSDEIQSIFDCIWNVAENHSDTIHLETIEYSNFPDIRFLVAFKRDSELSLHDWMYNIFCQCFNNECGKPYDEREYIDWINYMGADRDWAILEWSGKVNNLSPDECAYVTAYNHGRVPGDIQFVAVDRVGTTVRFIKCFNVTLAPDQSYNLEACLDIKERPDYWSLWVIPFPSEDCSYWEREYPKSPNGLRVSTPPEQPPEQPPPEQPPPEQPEMLAQIPTWMLVAAGIAVVVLVFVAMEEMESV